MTKIEQEKMINLLNRYKLCGTEYIEPLNFKIDIKKDDLPNDIIELENYVNHCNICELSKFKNSSNFSMGDFDSDIMIIGTDCNFLNENINLLLKSMIEKVLLLDFNKVYITNILKCNTNSSESISKPIELCKDYLIKQIHLSAPKLIITIGSAFNHLLSNDDNIFDVSGNIYEYQGIKLIPLLDVDFIYKNPSYKHDMFNDLKKIKIILE